MHPDPYEFARGSTETARLNQQHEILLETVGYCIHPSIRPNVGTDARIADVGTGTGAWLQACSRELPSTATLDGFDISDLNFPQRHDTPSNVNFIVADAKQPFPAKYHGAYDFVHLRLMVATNARDDWSIMAQNVIQLLKPGGSIQWEEPDLWNVRVLREKVESQTDNLARLIHYWNSTMGEKLLYGFSTLPAIYQAFGLVNVREDVVASDRLLHNRIPFAKISADGAFGWARLRAMNGMSGALTMEQVEEMQRGVDRDFESGAYTRYDVFIITGSRPLS